MRLFQQHNLQIGFIETLSTLSTLCTTCGGRGRWRNGVKINFAGHSSQSIIPVHPYCPATFAQAKFYTFFAKTKTYCVNALLGNTTSKYRSMFVSNGVTIRVYKMILFSDSNFQLFIVAIKI